MHNHVKISVYTAFDRAQKELVLKEQEEEGVRKHKNKDYADNIRNQIRQKEQVHRLANH